MMDEIEQYDLLIDELSSFAIDQQCLAIEILEYHDRLKISPEVVRTVLLRQQLLSSADREKCQGYMSLGFLTNYQDDERTAAWLVLSELLEEITIKDLRRAFLPYNIEQPLFREVPDLWKKVRFCGNRLPELLDVSALQWDSSSQLVDLGHTRGRFSIRSGIISWLKEQYPNSPLYARIDPFDVAPNLQDSLVQEVLRSIDPKWWKTLKIWPNEKAVGIYELYECRPQENLLQYLDHQIRGFGRLEVQFNRDNSGILKGMLEELPRPSDKRHSVGRCLHMTSTSSVGTQWGAGIAAHIDGAVNVYVDEDIMKRWNRTLEEKTNATFRTHLFRVENIPLRAIIPLAAFFFESEYLLNDWLRNQFGEEAKIFEMLGEPSH